jgi:NAD(P)-dependent dehydrogenase (short-subunit alcohol dehydrogenase family)
VPDPRFAGKVALVTGGTSGIGRAVAHGFARDGAAVVIAGRNAERGEAVRRELEEMGARALFVAADVSHPDDVEALVDRAVERFGRLDCATNNAAALDVGVFKATADFGDDEFDGHMALNLKSVRLCLKHEIAQIFESVFERLSPSDTTAAHAGYAQMVPLGRIGQPEEAAEAVLWLCSEAASYVTGHSMIVDGGVTAPYR